MGNGGTETSIYMFVRFVDLLKNQFFGLLKIFPVTMLFALCFLLFTW